MTTQTNKRPENRNESGNALFLILIAVALFAALSYAVTQSGRGGGTIDKEQGLISASQITQFPAAVRTGVTRMVITGTQVTALRFDTSSPAGSDEVFASEGGGVILQDPPANIGSATAWGFKDASDATLGYYVRGVGTDVSVSGREIIAYLDGVSVGVCQQINKGLGLATTPADESAVGAVDFTSGGGLGIATYANGATNVFDANVAEPFSCVDNGANNVYYHALVEQ